MIDKMLLRMPRELKVGLTGEAKRIGVSSNAFVLQILWDWWKRHNKEG